MDVITGDRSRAGTIKVLIVDDHRMVTQAFARVVAAEADLEPVGVASDVDEAIELCQRLEPDVVLMDYQLPSGDGITCAARMKELDKPPRVLILTGACGPEQVARAVREGCDGLLMKTASADELTRAIRSVHRGDVAFSPNDLAKIITRAEQRPPTFDLSSRELEVLQCLAEGQSTTAIGDTLYISVHTVRSHVRHILEKLGAHSKLEAVVVARRCELVA